MTLRRFSLISWQARWAAARPSSDLHTNIHIQYRQILYMSKKGGILSYVHAVVNFRLEFFKTVRTSWRNSKTRHTKWKINILIQTHKIRNVFSQSSNLVQNVWLWIQYLTLINSLSDGLSRLLSAGWDFQTRPSGCFSPQSVGNIFDSQPAIRTAKQNIISGSLWIMPVTIMFGLL